MMFRTRFFTALFIAFGVLAAPALAGPPLICHSLDIGGARSLPWIMNGRWNGTDPGYDAAQLISDVGALLAPRTPTDVRMETLRRAAIYSAREAGLSDRLMAVLAQRASNAGAGQRDPQAWFDAGYFVETVRQAARVYPMLHGAEREAWMIRTEPNVDGLAWIRRAARLGDGGAQPVIAIVERARAEAGALGR